uniref:NADH-ubiquinone oxidoreductase chain 6 n=1 Tax=Eudorina elegans TaxID=47282 RepID=A0A6M9TTV0_9CHLO|nr:NADH dehydrogenase subunit 6 [Eudorina elegans]
MFFENCAIILCALLSIAVAYTKSPFMSLMYSVMLFINSSFVLMMLGFEFLALVNLLVYVGALAVLFLFVIMLLEIPATELRAYSRGWSSLGILVFILNGVFQLTPSMGPRGIITGLPGAESISNLGHALYLYFADLLILNSFVLTVALFGAFAIAPVRTTGR